MYFCLFFFFFFEGEGDFLYCVIVFNLVIIFPNSSIVHVRTFRHKIEIFVFSLNSLLKTVSIHHLQAGIFSILGGELEMQYVFDRLYKHDITKTIRDLGLKLNNAANFEVVVEIRANNGSLLDSSVLPNPTIAFVPGTRN